MRNAVKKLSLLSTVGHEFARGVSRKLHAPSLLELIVDSISSHFHLSLQHCKAAKTV